MTCTNMLTLLLEAERDELEGNGTSVVAAHVRTCARCRAVAAQLLSDTHMLAAHVAATAAKPRSARRVRKRSLLWGGALAAASLAVLLISQRAAHLSIDAHAPPVVRASAPAEAPKRDTTAGEPRAKDPGSVRATRFEAVVAATPVRFAESQAVEAPMPPADSLGVSVVPPADKHAMVLATRNAKITVVWLY
jgi:hypothetical protein